MWHDLKLHTKPPLKKPPPLVGLRTPNLRKRLSAKQFLSDLTKPLQDPPEVALQNGVVIDTQRVK